MRKTTTTTLFHAERHEISIQFGRYNLLSIVTCYTSDCAIIFPSYWFDYCYEDTSVKIGITPEYRYQDSSLPSNILSLMRV